MAKIPRVDVDGILVIDKPTEWTSHDVVAKIRGFFKLKKVGHAGTLDPMATGVIVLLSGKGTKASNFLINDNKEYVGDLLLGTVTDSQDITGDVIEQHAVPDDLTIEQVEKVLDSFRGSIEQLPPMFSAVKINGVRLYKLGRKGQEVKREPRSIKIYELEILSFKPPKITLRIACSKGTYVRTLCHDIGAMLGCGGTLASLQRTVSGKYKIEDAVTMDQILAWDLAEFEKNVLPVPLPSE